MSARARRDGLWKQVDLLLQRRPGWTFQAIATPGVPPVWYFGAEGDSDLSVTVDKGSICAYETVSEQEIRFASTDELVAWLTAHKPGSLQPQKGSVVDKLKRAKLFEWE